MRLTLGWRAPCPNCGGDKYRTPICKNCNFKGTIPDPRGDAFPVLKCEVCKGKGRVRKPCYYCRGTGKNPEVPGRPS